MQIFTNKKYMFDYNPVLATWDIRSKMRGERAMWKTLLVMDNEEKPWLELIIRANVLERITP